MITIPSLNSTDKYDPMSDACALIKKLLSEAGASDSAAISADRLFVLRPHLFRFKPELAVIFTVPYRVKSERTDANISEYAVPRDYHIFFRKLFGEISARLSENFPDLLVFGASDHSPIDEVRAADDAGLGVIGKNRLLITPRHGSYVFIGEIYLARAGSQIADTVPSHTFAVEGTDHFRAIPECIGCGACEKACPSQGSCLSALTQKKGELCESEMELIRKSGCAWGCDICQTVCPMNLRCEDTTVPFFLEDRKEKLSSEQLDAMSDDEFSSRAYAWRGRKTIARNLRLFDE